jgi:hypothetical protein
MDSKQGTKRKAEEESPGPNKKPKRQFDYAQIKCFRVARVPLCLWCGSDLKAYDEGIPDDDADPKQYIEERSSARKSDHYICFKCDQELLWERCESCNAIIAGPDMPDFALSYFEKVLYCSSADRSSDPTHCDVCL